MEIAERVLNKVNKSLVTLVEELGVQAVSYTHLDVYKRQAFFQHERLVHLIVTVTFAILTMMSIIASIMISNPMLLVLTLLFFCLLYTSRCV